VRFVEPLIGPPAAASTKARARTIDRRRPGKRQQVFEGKPQKALAREATKIYRSRADIGMCVEDMIKADSGVLKQKLPEESTPIQISQSAAKHLEMPVDPGDHSGPNDPTPLRSQLKAAQKTTSSRAAWYEMRRETRMAKGFKMGKRGHNFQSDPGLYAHRMPADESDVRSELESDSTSLDDALGSSSGVEPNSTFTATRQNAAATHEHDRFSKHKQTRAAQKKGEPPRRVRNDSPPRYSIQKQLARLWNKNDRQCETLDSDESDSTAERHTSPPSFTSTRTTPKSNGKQSMGKGVLKPKQKKSALDELDELTDRLRLRHEQRLRKFKMDKNECGDGTRECQDILSPTTGSECRWDDTLESDIEESLRRRSTSREDDFVSLSSECQSSLQSATPGRHFGSQSSSSSLGLGQEASSTKRNFLPARRLRKLPVCELPSFDLPSFAPTEHPPSRASSSTDPDPTLNPGTASSNMK